MTIQIKDPCRGAGQRSCRAESREFVLGAAFPNLARCLS
jgi:hypothetical protein